MSEPEPGDKVSWNWGGGAPGGTVAEKKTEGEIAITSKRGNKIKKNADKNDPAVHIERSGNDVVKRASELNVEKKGSKSSGGDKKNEGKNEENKGEKRKHDKVSKEEKESEPLVENEDGKEVKPGGKDANKKQKKDEKPAAKKDDKSSNKKSEEKGASKDEEKKKGGRPKKDESSSKKKKDPAPRKEGDLVSSRTRSRAK